MFQFCFYDTDDAKFSNDMKICKISYIFTSCERVNSIPVLFAKYTFIADIYRCRTFVTCDIKIGNTFAGNW